MVSHRGKPGYISIPAFPDNLILIPAFQSDIHHVGIPYFRLLPGIYGLLRHAAGGNLSRRDAQYPGGLFLHGLRGVSRL